MFAQSSEIYSENFHFGNKNNRSKKKEVGKIGIQIIRRVQYFVAYHTMLHLYVV